MSAPQVPETAERTPKGFDSGLKCLVGVFAFTLAVRLGLTLALRGASTFTLKAVLIGVILGLGVLFLVSYFVWSRRNEAMHPPRRWAVVLAMVWVSAQILTYIWIMTQSPGRSDTAASTQEILEPEKIERQSFSVSLPPGWKENTTNENYNAESFVMFENSASCVFGVLIGKRAAGASALKMLQSMKDGHLRQLTEPKLAPFGSWGRHHGQGLFIMGKAQGLATMQIQLFPLETEEHACVVLESGLLTDQPRFRKDFEMLRQSFMLR